MMSNPVGLVTAIIALAFLNESLCEYFIAPLLGDHTKYVAAGTGCLLAAVFRVDVFVLLGLQAAWPWAGYLLTGVVLGRGANFVNDFVDRFLRSTDEDWE